MVKPKFIVKSCVHADGELYEKESSNSLWLERQSKISEVN